MPWQIVIFGKNKKPLRVVVAGIYLAESLTRKTNGYCMTSIVDTLVENTTIDSPLVGLEETENINDASVTEFTISVVWDSKNLSIICEELRTGHLNSEEMVSLKKVYEECSDVLYLTRR
jgi:hypothetical protein